MRGRKLHGGAAGGPRVAVAAAFQPSGTIASASDQVATDMDAPIPCPSMIQSGQREIRSTRNPRAATPAFRSIRRYI